jgi:hypothetical protein
MKKIVVALAIAAVAATASVSMGSQLAGTGINGSMHDINSLTGFGYSGDALGRSCVFCHTPHNAFGGTNDGPLWNHAQSSAPQMDAYTWSAPANAIGADPSKTAVAFEIKDPLAGPSRLCMACHDGSTAVDSHGTAAAGANGSKAMDSKYANPLGGADVQRFFNNNLGSTHPIGFNYDDAFNVRGAKELVPSTGKFLTGNIADFNFDTHARTGLDAGGKKISEVLYGGVMTCASCHDVHNTNNAVPDLTTATKYNYFLWAKEEGSAICLSCHVK